MSVGAFRAAAFGALLIAGAAGGDNVAAASGLAALESRYLRPLQEALASCGAVLGD